MDACGREVVSHELHLRLEGVERTQGLSDKHAGQGTGRPTGAGTSANGAPLLISSNAALASLIVRTRMWRVRYSWLSWATDHRSYSARSWLSVGSAAIDSPERHAASGVRAASGDRSRQAGGRPLAGRRGSEGTPVSARVSLSRVHKECALGGGDPPPPRALCRRAYFARRGARAPGRAPMRANASHSNSSTLQPTTIDATSIRLGRLEALDPQRQRAEHHWDTSVLQSADSDAHCRASEAACVAQSPAGPRAPRGSPHVVVSLQGASAQSSRDGSGQARGWGLSPN